MARRPEHRVRDAAQLAEAQGVDFLAGVPVAVEQAVLLGEGDGLEARLQVRYQGLVPDGRV